VGQQQGEEASKLVDSQRNQSSRCGLGVTFVAVVTARKACASTARVVQRCQEVHRRT
jgi:hypothetical protein